VSNRIGELATDDAPPHATGFRTLDAEIVLESLPTEGRFPDWLEGSLVRNGPGKFEAGNDLFNHHFDGFASCTDSGSATARCRTATGTCEADLSSTQLKKAEWDTRSSLRAWTPIDWNASRSNSERGTLRMSTRASPWLGLPANTLR
jgi:hypothetical protein